MEIQSRIYPNDYNGYLDLCSRCGVKPELTRQQFNEAIDPIRLDSASISGRSRFEANVDAMFERSAEQVLTNLGVSLHLAELVEMAAKIKKDIGE